MKIKIGKKYITKFESVVPPCNKKWWMCKHEACKFWSLGWMVRKGNFGFIKYLVWEQPTVSENYEK